MSVFLNKTFNMDSLLHEPAYSCTGLTDAVVDATVVEVKTFQWDHEDADTDVVFERTKTVNADKEVISASFWSVTNAPTITDISTDQSDDATVSLNGLTTLTITGENFGAENTDLQVQVWVNANQSANVSGVGKRLCFTADVVSVNGPKTELVATLLMTPQYGSRVPAKGPCWIEITNSKRLLKSGSFELTVV